MDLTRDGAAASNLAERVTFLAGDILAPPADVAAGAFDHVMANPPYMRAGSGNPPAHAGRAMATVEGAARLTDWLEFCAGALKPGGSLTMVHRADRQGELLEGMAGLVGDINVFPLLPTAGTPPKRILVQGTRGAAAGHRVSPGMVLHEAGRKYTAPAETVLRDAAPLLLWDGHDQT